MFKEPYRFIMTESLSFKHLIVWSYTQVPIPSYIHRVFTARKQWTFVSTNIGICPNTIVKLLIYLKITALILLIINHINISPVILFSTEMTNYLLIL